MPPPLTLIIIPTEEHATHKREREREREREVFVHYIKGKEGMAPIGLHVNQIIKGCCLNGFLGLSLKVAVLMVFWYCL